MVSRRSCCNMPWTIGESSGSMQAPNSLFSNFSTELLSQEAHGPPGAPALQQISPWASCSCWSTAKKLFEQPSAGGYILRYLVGVLKKRIASVVAKGSNPNTSVHELPTSCWLLPAPVSPTFTFLQFRFSLESPGLQPVKLKQHHVEERRCYRHSEITLLSPPS